MKAASKYESKRGSFIIEINGDCISVNNASNPTDRNMHFDMLAEINQYIRAMYSLGVATHLIYAATIAMLCTVDCARFVESW